MKKNLFWQLPWAGPSLREEKALAWAVMPSPGMGDAWGVCVPVKVVDDQVLLALARPQDPIALVPTPMGSWTPLPAQPALGEDGYLSLIGYDQPDTGTNRALIEDVYDMVDPAQLAQVLASTGLNKGGLLKDHIVPAPTRRPAPAMGQARPSASPNEAPHQAPDCVFTFAFGSCQYPSGLMDGLPAQASLQRLADLLDDPAQRARHPERLLLLGDQIYADATAGLLDPIRVDDRYRVPYDELLQIAPLRRIMGRIPIHFMLDDHEIEDNWEPQLVGGGRNLYHKALNAFWNYQRGVPQGPMGASTWFQLPGAGWSLFMADTRSRRKLRTESNLDSADILGPVQRQELEDWLKDQALHHADDLKVIASPAMLLPRLVEHADEPLHLDGWQGYPDSLEWLLTLIWQRQIGNVLFVSGDAHLSCDVDIRLTGPGKPDVTMRSVHAPALYAPMPFANEQPWNLRIPDDFQFPGPQGPMACHVDGTVKLPRKDGSCLVQATRSTGRWTIACTVV